MYSLWDSQITRIHSCGFLFNLFKRSQDPWDTTKFTSFTFTVRWGRSACLKRRRLLGLRSRPDRRRVGNQSFDPDQWSIRHAGLSSRGLRGRSCLSVTQQEEAHSCQRATDKSNSDLEAELNSGGAGFLLPSTRRAEKKQCLVVGQKRLFKEFGTAATVQ